jgi:hypothetical protein
VIKACLTFDIDLVEYAAGWRTVNEFDVAVPNILATLRRNPEVRTTWFVRLDDQIRLTRGSADYFFRQYSSLLDELRRDGHEIAWHPHCYRQVAGEWKQNVDEDSVIEELRGNAPVARDYGLRSVRMGWGFHTNRTMRLLADLGFEVDSSAIPRPQYGWEETQKDWSPTPNEPYFPAVSDYRVPGRPELPILEVPMSVTHVPAPYDGEHVLRYLSMSYHPHLLRTPLKDWLARHSHLITITHPYELVENEKPHGLLAFDPGAFESNLRAVREVADEQGKTVSFLTVSKFAAAGVVSHA